MDNIKFKLAVVVNSLALGCSVWWLFDSNWNESKLIEIEPIVSSLALLATLFGLIFVNDKLSKPKLKVNLSGSLTHPTNGDEQQIGMCVSVQNHSIIKTFIKGFYLELPSTNTNMHFLHDGFTGRPLSKVILEPGQEFTFYITKKDLNGQDQNLNKIGKFVVETDIGHKFIVPRNEVKKHLEYLYRP